LNKVLRQKTRKQNIVILMGDMNAKVGAENEGLKHIMGKHGLGNQNRHGELFVDLCAREDMVSGGTPFPHKNCRKVTWISPDYNTENQIDHFAISRKWRRSLQDVRNKRGADIGSDHHLVVALFKLTFLASQRKYKLVQEDLI
jgi:endonuclease/exonuclease/phosphatase family metal-dependent hydrolase